MLEELERYRSKRIRQGSILTLLLLLYGLIITLLYYFGGIDHTAPALAPFPVAEMPLSYWINPIFVFLPLALFPLAGWAVLKIGKLWGRECIIAAMIVYLALDLVFVPFYILLVSGSWQLQYIGEVVKLGICGIVYPILVLIALHHWNPRRK